MADNNSKVVPLRSGAALKEHLPSQFLSVKNAADQYLGKSLRTVFDVLDDAFFDLADKAENSRQQTLYFDAMRAIRMERKPIESRFFSQLDQRLLSLKTGVSPARKPETTSKRNLHDLELVGDEHLEEMITLDTMVSKCLEHSGRALEDLSARLSGLLGLPLTLQNNPFGPEVLCDLFSASTKKLNIDIRSRLVLYKLFERKVLAGLEGFYKEANLLLENLGIIARDQERLKKAPVKEKPPVNKAASSKPKSHAKRAMPAREGVASDRSDRPARGKSTVEERLSGREGRLVKRLVRLLDQGKQYEEQSADLYEASVDELIDLIEDIQSGLEGAQGAGLGPIDLAELLENQLGHREDMPSAKLHRHDQQVVRLVDNTLNLFNHDSAIPDDVSVLVQQLKLPILRLALQDASFFEKQKHPARRLLNEIAQLSVRFEEGIGKTEDPLFSQMQRLIDNVTSRQTLDHIELTRLFADFLAEIERHDRRIRVLEKRILEEAAAKEKVNEAHTRVSKALSMLLEGEELPLELLEFAEKAWSKVLFLDHLKEEKNTDLWKADVHSFRQFKDMVATGNAPLAEFDALVEQLRERLDHTAYDPHLFETLVASMEYIEGLGVVSGDVVLVEQFNPDLPGEVIEMDVSEEETGLETDLEQGSWFDLADEADDVHKRCKLAGILQPHSKYIFVDRQGSKEAALSRARVAQKIRDKKLRHLDNTKLFEQALDAVIEQIKHDSEH